jgi:hypothetical protein
MLKGFVLSILVCVGGSLGLYWLAGNDFVRCSLLSDYVVAGLGVGSVLGVIISVAKDIGKD